MTTKHLIQTAVLLTLIFLSYKVEAQSPAKDSPEVIKNLILSYEIKATTDNKKTVLADVYDGGVKTVFIQNKQARVRLVSLMRIESIYFLPGTDTARIACLIKESGKDKYKHSFGLAAWENLNSKYNTATCELQNDSLVILGYTCRKALIRLNNDGKVITAYYTDSLKPVSKIIEPAFACIPGLVLQYSYEYKSGITTYTANAISFEKADPKIFIVPTKGYKEIKD